MVKNRDDNEVKQFTRNLYAETTNGVFVTFNRFYELGVGEVCNIKMVVGETSTPFTMAPDKTGNWTIQEADRKALKGILPLAILLEEELSVIINKVKAYGS